MCRTCEEKCSPLRYHLCRTSAREELRLQVGTLRFDLNTLINKLDKTKRKQFGDLKKTFLKNVCPYRSSALKQHCQALLLCMHVANDVAHLWSGHRLCSSRRLLSSFCPCCAPGQQTDWTLAHVHNKPLFPACHSVDRAVSWLPAG